MHAVRDGDLKQFPNVLSFGYVGYYQVGGGTTATFADPPVASAMAVALPITTVRRRHVRR
jgi:hypothetical protein